MPLVDALRHGARRVNAAPAVLAGAFAITALLTLPLMLTLRGLIEADLGGSLAAETAAAGVNYDWWQEFSSRASGLGATFSPSIIGFAAVLENQSNLLDNVALPVTIASVVGANIVVWLFLVGGILDRYARNRPTRAAGFFASSGVFFFRFLRLAAIGWLVYYVLFRYVHGFLFDRVYSWAIQDMAVERTAFLIRLALYLLFAAVLLFFNLIFDYAKIRTVVEDRRSMIGSLLAALRFVIRRPGQTSALYLTCGAAFVAVVLLYALVAPGAGGTGLSMWTGLTFGELFIAARLWTRLLFFASQTAYFQSELAHAAYVAAPLPVWPESPSVEALETVR